jgi:hypothetical protein
MRMLFIDFPPFRYTFRLYAGAWFRRRWQMETTAIIVGGWYQIHLTWRHCCLLFVGRNSRLGRVGNTADSSSNMNLSRWIITRFLEARGKHLSTIEGRLDLYLFNLRFAQSLTRILPFNAFSTHFLMLRSKSLLRLETIALRSLGLVFFSTCSV